MIHFEKIASRVDVTALRSQIGDHPELWDQFGSRKVSQGTPHSRMSDIWVRYRDPDDLEKLGRERFNDIHVPVWYPAWTALTALQPIVFDLMAQVRGEMLGGILITRIPNGEGIAKHIDTGWHVETFRKFYLTIEGGEGAKFFCNHDGVQEYIEPVPGDIWEFDNRKLHWVINESGHDRMTAIICIRADSACLSI